VNFEQPFVDVLIVVIFLLGVVKNSSYIKEFNKQVYFNLLKPMDWEIVYYLDWGEELGRC
jgi:hypothetical protein